MIVVGVDPDSSRHGVAIYSEGQLTSLHLMTRGEVMRWLAGIGLPVMFSIENALANSFVYARNRQSSLAANAKVGIGIGRCQQAQEELMRDLDDREVPYQLHKPTGHNWAKDKARFQRTTGWLGKSNEETRSAAFFGWLAVQGMLK